MLKGSSSPLGCPHEGAGFLQGIHGAAQGRSNLPLQCKISTKAPEPPAGCARVLLGTAALGQGGKNYPEELTGQQMCPEGLETRRKSSSPREERLSFQPSWKQGDLGPMLQHLVRACVCSALALFAPGLHGELSSLQLSICKSHERLAPLIIWFLLMCILSLQSLFIKNNFLLEI